MCHGPSLQDTINKQAEAEQALQAEITRLLATMGNSEAEAIAYINLHSNGIVVADNKSPEIVYSTSDSYTKFSDDYSIDALDKVVDASITTAQDAVKTYTSSGDSNASAVALVGSLGGLVKSGLALAASNSETDTKLSVTFSQFSVGDLNFAMYNAINSGIVSASNHWGNKQITLVAQCSVLARVNADTSLTAQEALQDDLNTLLTLEKMRNESEIEAVEKGTPNSAALAEVGTMITEATTNITKDRSALAGKTL
jgi:hypothetical protein